MPYIEYILLFLLILASVLFFLHFLIKIRKDHFCKIITKALLRKQEKRHTELFFSSFAIKKIVSLLLRNRAKRALRYLLSGRTYFTIKFLEEKGRTDLRAVLEGFDNLDNAAELIHKEIHKNPQNYWLIAELANIYFVKQDKPKVIAALERINAKKSNSYTKAKKLYLEAWVDMNEGNMFPASQAVSVACKLFNKEKAYIEEANAFMLMGTIYRLSAVADIAQMMFDEALKIYSRLNFLGGVADANGNLGMLMVLQERFDEALDFFNKSLELNLKANRTNAYADVLNQIGLLYLINKDFDKSSEKILEALELHKGVNNEQGQAFSQDILSHINYGSKHYKEALYSARLAESLYKKIDNLTSYLESLYMQSLITFDEEDFGISEEILRKIIEEAKGKDTSFHVANAYNLLGLIFMKKGELPRAKTLFQQSLALEQKNERMEGIAVDYANMGLIEKKLGNKQQAQKNLEAALEYACSNGETELSCLIKDRIKQLSNR